MRTPRKRTEIHVHTTPLNTILDATERMLKNHKPIEIGYAEVQAHRCTNGKTSLHGQVGSKKRKS